MKINDEPLFFMIKSRLFAHLAFFPPSICERRGPSVLFPFRSGRLCPHSPRSPIFLPDQHPFAAPSSCLLLGLEISCSSPLNCCRVFPQNDRISEYFVYSQYFVMGLQNCFALTLPQGDQALLFMIALEGSDFDGGSAVGTFRSSTSLK